MNATRERVLVGLFVLIGAALLFVTVLAISGGVGSSGVARRTYFKYSGGVQTGTPVRYGGLLVGKVDRVHVDPADSTRIEIDFLTERGTPIKTDSLAKITTLGPLGDNYIEITTGTITAALLPPGVPVPSTEMFGLPQLGDAAQAMLPELQHAMQKLNANLDGLQVTLARANDLLNDGNRAAIAHSLSNTDRLLSETRPKLTESLDNVNRLLNDAQPKVSASLSKVQELTAKMSPMLDDLQKVSNRANDTLAHMDATLVENRPDIRSSVTNLRDALSKSTALLDRLNQSLDQNSGNIDQVLDNIRVSTQNLEDLTETLRNSPASLIRGLRVEDRKPGGGSK